MPRKRESILKSVALNKDDARIKAWWQVAKEQGCQKPGVLLVAAMEHYARTGEYLVVGGINKDALSQEYPNCQKNFIFSQDSEFVKMLDVLQKMPGLSASIFIKSTINMSLEDSDKCWCINVYELYNKVTAPAVYDLYSSAKKTAGEQSTKPVETVSAVTGRNTEITDSRQEINHPKRAVDILSAEGLYHELGDETYIKPNEPEDLEDEDEIGDMMLDFLKSAL